MSNSLQYWHDRENGLYPEHDAADALERSRTYVPTPLELAEQRAAGAYFEHAVKPALTFHEDGHVTLAATPEPQDVHARVHTLEGKLIAGHLNNEELAELNALKPLPQTARTRGELDQYQHEAMSTSGDNGRPPEHEHMKWIMIAALGLAEEAGEVGALYKKLYEQDREFRRDTLVKELGDVLWYIARIASIEDISLSEIASANLAKLRARYPNGFVPGGGVR